MVLPTPDLSHLTRDDSLSSQLAGVDTLMAALTAAQHTVGDYISVTIRWYDIT